MSEGEHRAACFRLAADRESRGLKKWAETLDVSAFFHAELPFDEIRDRFVAALRATRWYKRRSKPVEDNVEFIDAVDCLEQSEDANEFDQYLAELYDIADLEDRVWIKTF